MLAKEVDEFCTQLRRRQIEGSLPSAKRTAEIMRLLITSQRHESPQALIDDIREVGIRLQAAKPLELSVGNIVRRVLHMVREESEQEVEATTNTSKTILSEKEKVTGLLSRAFRQPPLNARAVSLHNLLDQGMASISEQPEAATPKSVESDAEHEGGRKKKGPGWQRKQVVIEMVNELIDELDEIENEIAKQAVEHIHANEVILTFGYSRSVQLFLQEACKKRNFQLVVAEGAPDYGGHATARLMAEAGIQTTAIADAAVFAMMARVNKVLVSAHALLANGGIIAPVGTHVVALAAKKHSIPLVVLVGLHKLSPMFPHDPSVTFNDFRSPASVIDYDVVAEPLTSESLEQQMDTYVHVPNPMYDYVPPELISLFVTDTGGYTPSYVYRLLAEYFTREDFVLSKELLDSITR